MRLKSFSVQRYRSITTAKKIPLGRTTILVGPNNEGKSNILRALVAAMDALIRERRSRMVLKGVRTSRVYGRRAYDWETDYPVHLQEQSRTGQTIVTLEFQLTERELADFRDAIGSRLSGTLPIRVSLGPRDTLIEVAKQGRGSAALSRKSDQIAQFVTDRIDFQHIEAIRTASSAEAVVSGMVARELDTLEDNEEYRTTLARLDELQRPILENLSRSVHNTLKQFLHDVRSVSISVSSEARYYAVRRACEILVDDGTPTLLKYKGDGAQSLAALGIVRHASERGAGCKNLVIAIEEPESHLHPQAIHELKQVLDQLGETHQVLITTHNPLFVDRRNIRNNIVVSSNRAQPAKSVKQVREVLGVRASDNLMHAEIVLLVEGEDDRTALMALLPERSRVLAEALRQGTLAVDTLAGCSNLAYKVTSVRAAIALCHAFLDDDKAARDAFEKARLQGLLTEAEVTFCIRQGQKETELEDLYDTAVYEALFENRYRVSINSPRFKGKKKWSDRIKACFEHCGQQWNDRVEGEVKRLVSEAVASQPADAVCHHHAATLDALVRALETRITSKEKAQQVGALEEE